MKLIILRPQPAADLTAARAIDAGLDAIVAPIFAIEPVPWAYPDDAYDALPDGAYDALLITSANAVRHGGSAMRAVQHLPVLAVGKASAEMAIDAGFAVAITGTGDSAAVLKQAIAAGYRHLLWLAGADHMPLQGTGGLTITPVITYQSMAIEPPPELALHLAKSCIVLLHSARAATHFAQICARLHVDMSRVNLACLSQVVAAAAGDGWRSIAVADAPNDAAILSTAITIAMLGDSY